MVFTVRVFPWFSFVVVGTGPHRIQPQTQVVPRPNHGLLILLSLFPNHRITGLCHQAWISSSLDPAPSAICLWVLSPMHVEVTGTLLVTRVESQPSPAARAAFLDPLPAQLCPSAGGHPTVSAPLQALSGDCLLLLLIPSSRPAAMIHSQVGQHKAAQALHS